jgi:hypothetical protein
MSLKKHALALAEHSVFLEIILIVARACGLLPAATASNDTS